MGYFAPFEIFEKMLQLMTFSVHVYFKEVLNINNDYFHIK